MTRRFRGIDAGLSSPGKDCSTGWPQVNAKMGRLWAVRGQPRRRCPGERSWEAANISPGRSDEPGGWLRAASFQSAQGSSGLPSDHLDRVRGLAGKGRGLIPRKSSGRPINFRGTWRAKGQALLKWNESGHGRVLPIFFDLPTRRRQKVGTPGQIVLRGVSLTARAAWGGAILEEPFRGDSRCAASIFGLDTEGDHPVWQESPSLTCQSWWRYVDGSKSPLGSRRISFGDFAPPVIQFPSANFSE